MASYNRKSNKWVKYQNLNDADKCFLKYLREK